MPVTADSFFFGKSFPFCVYPVDFTTLDYSQIDPRSTVITGLSFNEVFYLYWNTEKITVSFNLIGDRGNITADTITVSSAAITAPSYWLPKKRVCNPNSAVPAFGPITIANGAYIDPSYQDYPLYGKYEPPSVDGGQLIESPISYDVNDDSYALWLSFWNSSTDMRLSGGGYYVSYTLGNSVTAGILSGSMQLYAAWDPSNYNTVTISNFSLTVDFYTYA